MGWFIALAWARKKPAPPAAALDEQFAELEARLDKNSGKAKFPAVIWRPYSFKPSTF